MQKIASDKLFPGMIVAEPVVTKRGQVIFKPGTELTAQLIGRLSFYNVEEVTVEDPKKEEEPEAVAPAPTPAAAAPTNISYNQRLKASPEFKQFQLDFAKNIEWMKDNFDAIMNGAGSECCDMMIEGAESLFKSRTSIELFDMIHNMRGLDDSVYAHSLNVALIARAIGKWCKMSRSDLDMLTVSGLLHDIGKTQIPDEVLNKPGKYTDEEWALVKSHPMLGYKILKGRDFDKSITLSALQHHERSDGSGYPRGLMDDEIDDFASIIAIADVYDAMTAFRSYRDPLCAFQVIAQFEKEGLSKYNTKYILTFLEHVASTYQNARVVLSNGKAGRVVYINKSKLSRPVIELDDKSIIDLSSSEFSELVITKII